MGDGAVIERIEGPAPSEDSSVPPDEYVGGLALPAPDAVGSVPLEQALGGRRSQREFAERPLDATEISQLLWAAQGSTDPSGKRSAPSAGGLYPLVLHLVTDAAVHRYASGDHHLEPVAMGDRRRLLASACLDQEFLARAPVLLVIGNDRRRSHERYGVRADRYAMLEAGHVAQNVLLEASALALAAVPIGSFYDAEVRHYAGFGPTVDPLYVIAVGHGA